MKKLSELNILYKYTDKGAISIPKSIYSQKMEEI